MGSETLIGQPTLDRLIGIRIDMNRRTDDAFLLCIEEERDDFHISRDLTEEWEEKGFEILTIYEKQYHTPGVWAVREGFLHDLYDLVDHMTIGETGFMYKKARVGYDF